MVPTALRFSPIAAPLLLIALLLTDFDVTWKLCYRLSSGCGHGRTTSCTPDHRRAGRGHRHDHPAHPLAPDARPAPPPGPARPHRPLRRRASGPAGGDPAPAGAGFSLESLVPALRRPRGGALAGRRARVSAAPADSADEATDHGDDSAELYGFAELQPADARARGVDGRSSRWSRPRCGTRARPRSPRPDRRRAGARLAALGRVDAACPRSRPSRCCAGTQAPALGADVAVTTRHGGVVRGPLRHPEPRPARGRRPRRRRRQPGPGRRRASASRSTTLVFARQVHGAAADARRPGRTGAAARSPTTTPCPTPTSSSR